VLDLIEAGPGRTLVGPDALERIGAEGKGVMGCSLLESASQLIERVASPSGPKGRPRWISSPTASGRRSCATLRVGKMPPYGLAEKNAEHGRMGARGRRLR